MNTVSDKLRVGVVGVGYLGKFHAEKYARMTDVDLVGLADIDAQAAACAADRLKTTAFGRHTDLIGRVDAVSIVVPTSVHFQIAKDFLNNGVDVLIEKPMTVTLAEADALVAVAADRDLIIQVGHLERFNPAVVALRGIVKRPLFIESHSLSLFRGRATDVSVVLDLMIHDIDLISNFAQSELISVHAAGVPVVSGEVDIANARLDFARGCVANVTASRISGTDERKIRLFQRDCYTSVDFVDRRITVIRRKGADPNSLIPGMDIQQLSFPQGDALDDELKAFVQSVRTRKPPQVDGRVGRDALRIALDVMAQINSKIDRYLNSELV